jgi:D-glycero-D-manno-heptose 1,7-bisphosphate phosphatase
VSGRPAVFLDRDGVLVEDVDLLVDAGQIRLLDSVAPSLAALHEAGFALVVVTNQSVVARGLVSEGELATLHDELSRRLRHAGGPALDAVYACPHHPNATLEEYRVDCACRKPRPGLLLQAEHDLDLSLEASVMVGDRLTDVAAGAVAGCATVLVRTGRHLDPPIESTLELGAGLVPDYECADLEAAVAWILGRP